METTTITHGVIHQITHVDHNTQVLPSKCKGSPKPIAMNYETTSTQPGKMYFLTPYPQTDRMSCNPATNPQPIDNSQRHKKSPIFYRLSAPPPPSPPRMFLSLT